MKYLVVMVFFFTVGCGPSFEIISTTDKFSDPSKPYGYIGIGNRISTKSVGGGVHIDEKGVYLNPYAEVSRTTGDVQSYGFFINHYNFTVDSGFRPITEVIFLTDDGGRIAISATGTGADYQVHGWNSISKEYDTSYMESAVAYISKNDLNKLCETKTIEIKINGGKRSETYEKDDISSDFLTNLRMFMKYIVGKDSRKKGKQP